jgi:hypothetical protein
MPRRAQALAVVLLTLHCILWLAVAPLIPSLHQSLASHRHVYNAARYEFEDAGPKRTHGEAVRPPKGNAAAVAPAEGGSTDDNSRRPCAFSKFNLPICAFGVGVLHHAGVALPKQRAIRKLATTSVRALEVLTFAPKRSPPGQRADWGAPFLDA